MTKKEIAIMELLKENKKAAFKDVIRFKIKWILKILWELI